MLTPMLTQDLCGRLGGLFGTGPDGHWVVQAHHAFAMAGLKQIGPLLFALAHIVQPAKPALNTHHLSQVAVVHTLFSWALGRQRQAHL